MTLLRPDSGHPVLMTALACALVACGEPEAQWAKYGEPVSAEYTRYCALCHGDRAEGGAADHAPALNNRAFLDAVTDEFLFQSVRRGRPGTPMSAFSDAAGGPLTDAQIRDIVLFLRQFQRGSIGKLGSQTRAPVDAARAARGARTFEGRCVACHGERGEGHTAPSLDNPVFHALAADELIATAILDGRPGTAMDGFRAHLSGDEVEELVHFIRSLAPPLTPAATTHTSKREGWATRPDVEVVLNPDGGAPHFASSNGYVPAEQVLFALEQHRRLVVLDARPTSDWRAEHLPGALPAPFYDEAKALARVPDDGTQIVVYCGCPHVAADRLASRLRDLGHRHVVVIEEGFFVWRDRGYPVVSEPDPVEVVSASEEPQIRSDAPE